MKRGQLSARSRSIVEALRRRDRVHDICVRFGVTHQTVYRLVVILRRDGIDLPQRYPLCQTCRAVRVRKSGERSCTFCRRVGCRVRISAKPCKVAGCERDLDSRGYCRRHYQTHVVLRSKEARRKHAAEVREWLRKRRDQYRAGA